MNWKNLPYWLKGGIIFGIVNFIHYFIYFKYAIPIYLYNKIMGGLYGPFQEIGLRICPIFNANCVFTFAHISFFIFFVGMGFAIGATIGMVYGKLKSK